MRDSLNKKKSNFQTVVQKSWKGLNEDENPNAVEEDELTTSFNTWKKGSAIGTRPGAVRDTTDYIANVAGPVQGGAEYRFANDASRFNVIVSGGDVLTNSTPTSIKAAGVITTGAANTWTFAQHRQRLYAAGGASPDWFWYWTGTGNIVQIGPIVDLSAAAIYPRYVFQKWNRLFTAGFRVAAGTYGTDAASNPMIVRYSALNDGTVWPLANTIGGTSTIGGLSSDGDEFITGFGEFTDNDGDWLLILTNKRLYAVSQTGNAINPFTVSGGRGAIQNGCVHQNAFVSLGLDSGDAIYLSPQGIHSLRQSQQYGALERTFLSWKIRRSFETFNQAQLAGAVGTYWRERGIVLFFVPTGSATQNLLGLALDVKNKKELTADTAEWHIWVLSGTTDSTRGINALWNGRTAGNDYVIFGGNENGDVFSFDDASFADLTVGYSTHWTGKHQDFGNVAMRKGVGDTVVVTQGNGTHHPTHRHVFDYGTVVGKPHRLDLETGGFTLDVSHLDIDSFGSENPLTFNKSYALGSGFTIADRFEHSTANQGFYVSSISNQIRLFGETEESA